MKLLEIFRLEIAQQSRRISTWIYIAVPAALTYLVARASYGDNTIRDGYLFNGPWVVAAMAVIGSAMGLLAPAALAGEAAARDVSSRMHPLLYAAPVGRAAYLGGRFLAAFTLGAVGLLVVPIATLLATLVPSPDPDVIGPFRPALYLGAYLFLVLPNVFVVAAIAFAMASVGRRAVAGYVAGALLFVASMLCWTFLAMAMGQWELGKLLDPLGLTAMAELGRAWTPDDKDARLAWLEGSVLRARLLWVAIAGGALALTFHRFRFAHHAASGWWGRRAAGGADAPASVRTAPIAVPRARRTFGPAARLRQTLAVARESLRVVVTGWGGLVLLGLALLVALTGPELMEHIGVPLFPTTGHLTAYIGQSGDLFDVLVPLLVAFYAGELVWRERDAHLAEMTDAAPVPEWVYFAGRSLGLALVLVTLQALMMAASILVQLRMGYHDFELGVYARILFGMQLADHLLFALLALAVHVVVDQKYVAHMIVLATYAFMTLAPSIGVEHTLLVYASDPGWSYSDMRRFGPFLGPWLLLELYWAAWALLLAVAARLLWVRGRERGIGARLRMARRRFTRSAVGAGAAAAGLLLTLGGFVFYNTNVLNKYRTASERTERRAEYERRYGRYDGAPQPRLTGTALHVEIHPARGEADIRGTHRLVNESAVAIDSVHLAIASEVATGAVSFDRRATRVHADEDLGHLIYALEQPLRPGDSLRLDFEVRFAPRGFPNRGIDASVTANGTYVVAHEWLPGIGYQRSRELGDAADRRAHGLAPRPAVPSLDDAGARRDARRADRIAVEVVVGTDERQLAIAPGALRRAWMENGRRYFHYATDAPIRNDYALYSADYAVREGRWNHVAIEIVHHPGHAWNADRMLRSVHASLEHLAGRFGPYPHGQIRLVEHPGRGIGLHASPVNISYLEGFSLLNPADDPRAIDFSFAVVAHEVAHQWWGNQLTPAFVEGAALLSESLAWYAALGVVEETHGREHLRRLLGVLREAYYSPRPRADVPLLRASDWFVAYRKGPLAMYALREYVGEERVSAALRRLLEAHGSGAPPLATSLDLYRELQAVTPDSLRYLLVDLFEANTYWELSTRQAAAERTGSGDWRVTLDVRARKVVVDTTGAEIEVPMDDLVEVGVFAEPDDGASGAPLYLRLHRIRSGDQRITVTVPGEPARAGVDPRRLLIEVEVGDNVGNAMVADARPAGAPGRAP